MKIYIYHIIIILLCSNIVIFIFGIHQRAKINPDYLYKYLYYSVRKKSELIASSELQPINPYFYLGKDTSNIINIYNLIHKYTLCFYFSTKTCPPCIDNTYESIKKIFPDYKTRNDILLISNDLEYKLRDNFYDKKILWNCSNNLNIIFEKDNIPTLFLISKDLKANCVFIIDKQMPELLEDYLKIIKQRFFSDTTNNENI